MVVLTTFIVKLSASCVASRAIVLASGLPYHSAWFSDPADSREYEREADLRGVQIMRGPEWLSDHPRPANRCAAINREAALLRARGSSTRRDP
jgi:hypothetical protein